MTKPNDKCGTKDLAQWISLPLKKALTKEKIMARFKESSIWPLNP